MTVTKKGTESLLSEMDSFFDEVEQADQVSMDKANAKPESEYTDLEALVQGSKAWFYNRLGLFTGSQFPKLMTGGRAKEMFGETSKGVIRKVYLERNLTEIGRELYVDELFAKDFRQTKWGNKYESYARTAYEALTGCVVNETSFTISPSNPNVGGSFDGDISGESKIIEIKCPYDIMVHDNNVQLSFEAAENLDVMKKHLYYGQIQANIFVGGVAECDFISYDPRMLENKLVVINVKRDDEYIIEMLMRIEIAEMAIKYLSFIDINGALLLALRDYDNGKK